MCQNPDRNPACQFRQFYGINNLIYGQRPALAVNSPDDAAKDGEVRKSKDGFWAMSHEERNHGKYIRQWNIRTRHPNGGTGTQNCPGWGRNSSAVTRRSSSI